MVVRFIPGDIPQFDTLGLPPVLKEVVMEKRGLILMVGRHRLRQVDLARGDDRPPQRAAQPGHILTIEDPIEFLFKHKSSIVNQREVGTDTKSYHVALKNALRQAPDVILIGEIRDRESMGMAIAYAQSGHLCLATLHANNSYHALNRIISFFPLENRPGPAARTCPRHCRVIVSQRLVRTPRAAAARPVEVLLNTRHVAELIEKGEVNEIKEAIDKSLAPGSQTFEQSLFKLYRDGTITQEEALANADSATNLLWLMNNADASLDAAADDGAQAGDRAEGRDRAAAAPPSASSSSRSTTRRRPEPRRSVRGLRR